MPRNFDFESLVEPSGDEALSLSVQGPKDSQASPYAFQVDAWSERRGKEIRHNLVLNQSQRTPVTKLDDHHFVDFHESLFSESPKLNSSCRDMQKYEFVKGMIEMSDYKILRESTVLDDMKSEMASVIIAKKFEEFRDKELKKRAEKTVVNAANKRFKSQVKQNEQSLSERRLLIAVNGAIRNAQQNIDEFEEVGRSFGVTGGTESKIDPSRAIALYDRYRRSHIIRRIIDMAGKYRMVAQSKHRVKNHQGMEDVIGIELNGEISRLIPGELANLCLEETELDTLMRLVNREAMSREYVSYEAQAKGPAILCIDESGSMSGNKIMMAKALALAFVYVARRQKRWCCLVSFSSSFELRYIVLAPGKNRDLELCEWLERFFGGGTAPPIGAMPDLYNSIGAPKGKTDIVYLTDDVVWVDQPEIDAFNVWRKSPSVNATVTTLSVACGSGGNMGAISDQVIEVSNLEPGQDGIGDILSI